jgi:hypothetical protein
MRGVVRQSRQDEVEGRTEQVEANPAISRSRLMRTVRTNVATLLSSFSLSLSLSLSRSGASHLFLAALLLGLAYTCVSPMYTEKPVRENGRAYERLSVRPLSSRSRRGRRVSKRWEGGSRRLRKVPKLLDLVERPSLNARTCVHESLSLRRCPSLRRVCSMSKKQGAPPLPFTIIQNQAQNSAAYLARPFL